MRYGGIYCASPHRSSKGYGISLLCHAIDMMLNLTFLLPRLQIFAYYCMLSGLGTQICTVPLLLSRELSHAPYNVVDLHDCTAVCVSDVTVGMFGHGFLIASDNLTRHPSGPGIQPEENISDLD